MKTFKDENRALQELVRELTLIRGHNLRFGPTDPQRNLLLFAEGALVCLTMEHYVRIVVGDALPGAKLFNLLQYSVSHALLSVPWDDQQEGIRKICEVRNTLLHGNYAQAARKAGCQSVEEYFQKQYASQVEAMFKITDHIMRQVDVRTGKTVPGAEPPKGNKRGKATVKRPR